MRMFTKPAAIVFICLFSFATLHSADSRFRLSNWKTHSSMLNCLSASADSQGRIWVATTGGVFQYNVENGEAEEFRNIDAMLSIDPTTVYCDTENELIFIGTYNGTLEIVSEDYKWEHILSIRDYGFNNPEIKDILSFEGKIIIAGGFGMAVFDPVEKIFTETILKIGTFQQNTIVNNMIISGRQLWVATDLGVASISLDSPNFSPEYWTNYGRDNGLPEASILDIASLRDTIFVTSENNIYKLAGDSFVSVTEDIIRSIDVIGDDLFYVTTNALKKLGKGHLPLDFPEGVKLQGMVEVNINGKRNLILFYESAGIGIYDLDSLSNIRINTPASNVFNNMDVDDSGNLWAVSDGSTRGEGFFKFDGSTWENFSAFENEDIPYPNNYYDINAYGNNVFVSSWGRGFLLMKSENGDYVNSLYDQDKYPMSGSSYPVAGEAREDMYGDVWFTFPNAYSKGDLLFRLNSEGSFDAFENRIISNDRNFMRLCIDRSGTKWLGSYQTSGLYGFNEMGTIDNMADDEYVLLTGGNSSLLDDEITTLATDKTGALWIGTKLGANLLINPSFFINNTQEILIEINDLKGKEVNAILVDELNFKWVATGSGVYVFDDENELIEIISTKDYPLVNDEVISLAINNKTGHVFFGTKYGLSQASSLSIEPAPSYDILCYPQPFTPSRHGEMVIDGLEANSEFRIVTTNGELIRRIRTLGRTAVWDGRDKYGNIVASGVYLVLADSESTNGSSVAKFAVVRK